MIIREQRVKVIKSCGTQERFLRKGNIWVRRVKRSPSEERKNGIAKKRSSVRRSHRRESTGHSHNFLLWSFWLFFFLFFPLSFSKAYDFLLWFFCEEQPADCLFISLDTMWFYKIPKLANLHMVHTEQISIKIWKVTSHYLQHKIQSLRMIPEILHGDSHAYCSFSVLAKSSPTSCFLPMLMGLMFPVCAILSHTSVTSRLLSFFQSNDFHSPTYDSHLFFSKISCINEVISTWLSLKTYSKLLHSTWFYHMGFLQFLGSDESVLHWLCGPPWIMSLRLSLIKQLRADFSFSPKTKTKTRERKH